jgi:hypothetical protein
VATQNRTVPFRLFRDHGTGQEWRVNTDTGVVEQWDPGMGMWVESSYVLVELEAFPYIAEVPGGES